MKITTTNNFSSLLHSVFARRSGADIYRLREKFREPWPLAQNPDLNSLYFAAFWRQIAALLWPLDPGFLLQVCYEVVIHVAF